MDKGDSERGKVQELALVLLRSLPIPILGGVFFLLAANALSLPLFINGAAFFMAGAVPANFVGYLGWHLRKSKVEWLSAWIMAGVFWACLVAVMIWDLEIDQQEGDRLYVGLAESFRAGLLILLGIISVPYFYWCNRKII